MISANEQNKENTCITLQILIQLKEPIMKFKINSRIAGLIVSAMMLAGGRAHAAELVVNGGFETGDLAGWNLQSVNYTGVSNESSNVSTGSYGLYAGQFGSNAILSQNINTVAGANYQFSFDEKNFSGGGKNNFQVFWDGKLLMDLYNAPANAYTNYLFDVVASGTSTEIKFGLRHDPYMFALDNVSVNAHNPSAVPIPGAIWLFGSASAAGLLARRRKVA